MAVNAHVISYCTAARHMHTHTPSLRWRSAAETNVFVCLWRSAMEIATTELKKSSNQPQMHSPSYFMCRLFERTSVLSCLCCCLFAFSTCWHSHVLKSQMHHFFSFASQYQWYVRAMTICGNPYTAVLFLSLVTLETGLPERCFSLASFLASLSWKLVCVHSLPWTKLSSSIRIDHLCSLISTERRTIEVIDIHRFELALSRW